jgi:hypothetical protein
MAPTFADKNAPASRSRQFFGRLLPTGFRLNTSKASEQPLAGADSFAVEHRKAQEAIQWMNAYAKKNNYKFESKLTGYSMQTVNQRCLGARLNMARCILMASLLAR